MWFFHRKNKKTVRASPVRFVHFKYDAAQTTSENARHWSMADSLSADGSMTSEVRRTLRNRARYEVANNSYARGMVLTLAADCIGTGPRLQTTSKDETFNSVVESEFAAWANAVSLAERLQTLRMAKITDGEAFAAILKNPKLKHPVHVDLQLIEADRITTPYPSLNQTVDGIEYDKYGAPILYHVASEHPGDSSAWHGAFATIPAEYMIHWFRADRPGQSRGLPEIMPALPLFAQLRRYTLAVLAAAETAADFAAVLYTDAPANGEAQPLEPLDIVSLEKRMATTLPDGWKLGQIKAEQPNTTYTEFKREILSEIGRCLQVPVNILTGDSSRHNYASGRLDHQTFFKSIRVEQSHCERVVLNPLFEIWYREALRVGLLTPPKATKEFYEMIPASYFFWDGMEHVDPVKEAKAATARIQSHVSNLATECAKAGLDWEDVLVQASREQKRMMELGLTSNHAIPAKNKTEKDNEETETDESDS
ncbi:MAG: phage portal protein [Planctomycetaceae bacterium]|nr:phage portal protein [Planctomycetaceae bacterium]